MKRCSKCHKEKLLSEFTNSKRYRDGKYPSCRECQYITNQQWKAKNPNYDKARSKRNKTPSRIYSRILSGSKIRSIPLGFSREIFIDWYSKQIQVCHYCGVGVEDLGSYDDSQLKRFKQTLSIDRMDNSRGYELDNMVLCCLRCNFIKSDFFSYREMLEIGEKYVKPKRIKGG